MERARDHEDHTSQSVPATGQSEPRLRPEPLMSEAPWEEPLDLEELETQPIPEYLTLELEVGDLPAFTAEAPALEVPEFLEPEERCSPGYLTLEIDLKTLEDESRGPSSGDLR